MAFNSVNLSGLPEIRPGTEDGMDLNTVMKLAQLWNLQSESASKLGTPPVIKKGTPPSPGTPTIPGAPPAAATGGTMVASKPWFASMRGYSPVQGIENAPTDMSSAEPAALNSLMNGGTAWVKGAQPATPGTPTQIGTPPTPGTPDVVVSPGTMGSKEFAERVSMAPYVLTGDKSDEELNAQAQILYNQPGTDALKKLKFSSRSAKPLHIVSDIESGILDKLGVDLAPGKVLTGDEFMSLQHLVGLQTQGRLAEDQAAMLSKMGWEIQSLQAGAAEKKAKAEKEKRMGEAYRVISAQAASQVAGTPDAEGSVLTSTGTNPPSPPPPQIMMKNPYGADGVLVNRTGLGTGWIRRKDIKPATDTILPTP